MKNPKATIEAALKDALKELVIAGVDPAVDHPASSDHGDYASNIALVAAKKLGQNPMELAEEIKKRLELRAKSLEQRAIEKIEVAPPGFINFWLSKDYLVSQLSQLLNLDEKHIPTAKTKFSGKNMLVEFAHPNTHKEFHIGHLRNITLGESICRLLEVSGAVVRRVNYQGDVGLHVAKALYGLFCERKTPLVRAGMKAKISRNASKRRNPDREVGGASSQMANMEKKTLEEKAKLLGKVYAAGSKAYEKDDAARAEIVAINKKIYEKDPDIVVLWQQTRQWSLDYFDRIYKRLGTSFDRLYFEGEVHESGKAIVLAHIADGIFTKDGGAVIFDGEKYSLHKRVFVTQEGNPTYEGKEMGLGPLQYKEFPFDLAIHIVGPEQADYFAVTFKALELIDPRFSGKEKHLAYGLVQLKDGKMSSRMGDVLSAEWLLDETKRMLQTQFSQMSDNQLEQVAVGAVKYSMLKVGLTQNIHFSFAESISLEGNSGPYIQYAYARTQSVLTKAQIATLRLRSGHDRKSQIGQSMENACLPARQGKWKMEHEEIQLLRSVHRFPEVVEEAGDKFAPNLLCNYLFDLAGKFNLFYQKHSILHPSTHSPSADGSGQASLGQGSIRELRLALSATVGRVLKTGLYLLGIAAPKRM